jgi:hypothetical protein
MKNVFKKVNLEVLEDRTVPSFILGANAGIILGPVSPPPVDTWYQDRYRPANFVYGQTGGGRTNIVAESISAADANGLRPTLSPTAYNIPFYDIQGEKYTFAAAERPTYLAVDLYVPSSWASLNQTYPGGDPNVAGSFGSLWAAGVDSTGTIINYPEIGFNNQTGGIAIKERTVGAWIPIPGFTGFDQWYQIGFDVNSQGQFEYFVDGQLEHTSTPTGVVVNFSDTFLQGYNAGNSYNIFWDHLTDTRTAIVATGANITTTLDTPFSGTVATFTTADTLDGPGVFQATITWGDGSRSTGTVTGGNGSFTVTGGHTYSAGGTFPLSVDISSPTSGAATATGSATVALPAGLTASPVFWSSSTGQSLIKSFNGNGSKQLGNWLASNFPNLFGANAGSANDLTNQNNKKVATYYLSLPLGSVQSEVLTTALNVYATTASLGGTAGIGFGFNVSATGLGAVPYTVGMDGAAFGVPDNTIESVFNLLLAVDAQTVTGVPYAGNPNQAQLQQEALNVLTAINGG